MANSIKRDYVLTTTTGMVPYIVDYTADYFKKARKLFLDDFLQKDSFFDKDHSTDLKKFVGSDEEVIVGFRNNPKILESKKGNYKLTEKKYTEILTNTNVSCTADFKTGKLVYKNEDVYEPKDLEDFNNSDAKMFGTKFINDLVEQGLILYEHDGKLVSKSINESDDEYHKYIWSIKEIISYTMLAEKNYKVFYDFLNK